MIRNDEAPNNLDIAVNIRGRRPLEAAGRRPVRDGSDRKCDTHCKFGADHESVVTSDLHITTERGAEYKGLVTSTKTVTTVGPPRASEPVSPVRAGSGPRDNRGVSQLNTPRSRP